MKILYLLQQFPKISSEAFILNEMVELQKMGHDVWILTDITNNISNENLHSLIIENNFMEKIITGEVYDRGLNKLTDFFKKVTSDLTNRPKATLKNLYFVLLNNPYYKNKNIWSKLDNYLILRKLPKINFDIVHSPFAHLEKIDKGLAIANILGVPFTTTFRALELYGDNCRKEILSHKKIFSKISGIATISKFNQQQLETIFGLDKKISIIHSSIDPEKFKPASQKIKEAKTRIITISRFVEKKGIIYLLEALSILKKDHINLDYLLIGDGPLLDTYNKKIQELNIIDIVKILHPMKQEQIKSALAGADLMVLPCVVAENGDRDIMANVLKEAMSMKIPVITSNISGIEELIIDRQNGILVPEKNASTLAEVIRELINNQELADKISQEGRKTIIENFNVKNEAKKLSSFFLETIEKFKVNNLRSTKINQTKDTPEKTSFEIANGNDLNKRVYSKKPLPISLILNRIIVHCDGMLPFDVYSKIYKYAYHALEGNMLELGAAHGAASICIAKGIIDSQKKATLLTVEKGNGKNGSMEKFGSKKFNITKLNDNIKYFNCDQNTIVLPVKIKEAASQITSYGPLSLLLIDADGAIDRDFMLFYNLLKPGSYIIIDDYENSKAITPYSKSNPLGKKYTTYLFVNYFLKEGLIEQKEIIGNTIFCRKPKKITGPITFNEGGLNLIRTNINLEAKKITTTIN